MKGIVKDRSEVSGLEMRVGINWTTKYQRKSRIGSEKDQGNFRDSTFEVLVYY